MLLLVHYSVNGGAIDTTNSIATKALGLRVLTDGGKHGKASVPGIGASG